MPVGSTWRRRSARESWTLGSTEPVASWIVSGQHAMTEQEEIARGVIRREETPFLSEYGTAYVLYDEEGDNYSYAIKSDIYRFSEYVGLKVEVSGPLTDVGRELAVMNVTRIQLSPDH